MSVVWTTNERPNIVGAINNYRNEQIRNEITQVTISNDTLRLTSSKAGACFYAFRNQLFPVSSATRILTTHAPPLDRKVLCAPLSFAPVEGAWRIFSARSIPAYAVYVELWSEGDAKIRKNKADNKTRYTCKTSGLNAWAEPGVSLMCGECAKLMFADAIED